MLLVVELLLFSTSRNKELSDIKKYLLKYGEVEQYESLPVNYRNEQYNDGEGEIIGIDIDIGIESN